MDGTEQSGSRKVDFNYQQELESLKKVLEVQKKEYYHLKDYNGMLEKEIEYLHLDLENKQLEINKTNEKCYEFERLLTKKDETIQQGLLKKGAMDQLESEKNSLLLQIIEKDKQIESLIVELRYLKDFNDFKVNYDESKTKKFAEMDIVVNSQLDALRMELNQKEALLDDKEKRIYDLSQEIRKLLFEFRLSEEKRLDELSRTKLNHYEQLAQGIQMSMKLQTAEDDNETLNETIQIQSLRGKSLHKQLIDRMEKFEMTQELFGAIVNLMENHNKKKLTQERHLKEENEALKEEVSLLVQRQSSPTTSETKDLLTSETFETRYRPIKSSRARKKASKFFDPSLSPYSERLFVRPDASNPINLGQKSSSNKTLGSSGATHNSSPPRPSKFLLSSKPYLEPSTASFASNTTFLEGSLDMGSVEAENSSLIAQTVSFPLNHPPNSTQLDPSDSTEQRQTAESKLNSSSKPLSEIQGAIDPGAMSIGEGAFDRLLHHYLSIIHWTNHQTSQRKARCQHCNKSFQIQPIRFDYCGLRDLNLTKIIDMLRYTSLNTISSLCLEGNQLSSQGVEMICVWLLSLASSEFKRSSPLVIHLFHNQIKAHQLKRIQKMLEQFRHEEIHAAILDEEALQISIYANKSSIGTFSTSSLPLLSPSKSIRLRQELATTTGLNEDDKSTCVFKLNFNPNFGIWNQHEEPLAQSSTNPSLPNDDILLPPRNNIMNMDIRIL